MKEERSADDDEAALAAEGVDVKQDEDEEGHAEDLAVLADLLDDMQEQKDVAVCWTMATMLATSTGQTVALASVGAKTRRPRSEGWGV